MTELDLFAAAIGLPDPAARAALLDRACAGDTALRERLEKLLAAHFATNPLLDPSTEATGTFGDHAATRDPSAEPTGDDSGGDVHAGAVIAGKYALVEAIGEGGMGSVWRAKQTEPVKRFVAVKLIKAGMDSKTVLARFEAERQALALMDHPNIAKVLDGGIWSPSPLAGEGLGVRGNPYFVMELVKGTPITEFCDANKFTPRQRLELFVQACQAIQHAHQKGVIHRDIKPSNVLVALYDDRPVVKVIDFGVAKATGGTLTEKTLDTGLGGVVGTPQYMSPEQATFNNLDIDTRSDVYALGVLLYELLAGSPPFSRKDLEKKGLLEILRVVREEEPPRPSTKLSTADALPSISANRGTEPKRLTGLLRNELDWIVMKALEKDRGRRYETANAFAADVLRHLAGEPVQAHPPSRAYRLKKFVRRNRPQVVAGGLVAVALAAGVVGIALGLLEARRQGAEATRQAEIARNEAEAKEQARAEEARQRAAAEANERLAGQRLVQVEAEKKRGDEERRVAQAVKDFLQKRLLSQNSATAQANALLLASGRAGETKPNPTVRELLDRAAKELTPDKIEASFPNQPLVQAEILQTVGNAYREVGEAELAVTFLDRSLDLFRRQLGPDHPDTIAAMGSLAWGYKVAGMADRTATLCEEAYRLTKAKFGPDHAETLTTLMNLASSYLGVGRADRAVPLAEEAVKLAKAKLEPGNYHITASVDNLAMAYRAAGRPGEALPRFQEAYRLTKTYLGPDHPHTVIATINLAEGYSDAGRNDRSAPLLEEVLPVAKAKLGPDHPLTLTAMSNQATGLVQDGRADKAVPLLEEVLKFTRAKLGPDHPVTLGRINNLAGGYRHSGRADRAVQLLEEVLKPMKAKLGPDHPDTFTAMNNLADAYLDIGRADKALPLFEDVLRLRKAKLGPGNPATLGAMNNLAECYRAVGQVDKLVPLLAEVLTGLKAALGPDHPNTLTVMNNLAGGYSAIGRHDKALPLFEEALRLRRAKLGPDHPDTLGAMNNLAGVYRDVGKPAEALPLFEEAHKRAKATLGAAHSITIAVAGGLAGVYQQVGRAAEALPLLEDAFKRAKATLGADHPGTFTAMSNLALGYRSAGQPDKAVRMLEDTLKLTEAKLGPDHPDTLDSVGNLGYMYMEVGQGEKAVPLLKRYAANRKSNPKNELGYAGLLAEMSLGLLKCDQYAAAEGFLRECLTIREKAQPDDWRTFNTRSMLGGALLGQKKYADAEPLLLKGYEGMKAREKAIPPQGLIRIPEALDRLIALSTATKKPDEANKYRDLRAAYPPELAPPPKAVK